METTTATPIYPVDLAAHLARPGRCICCGRAVSNASIDKGRAVMVKVDGTGMPTEDPSGYRMLLGPECKVSA